MNDEKNTEPIGNISAPLPKNHPFAGLVPGRHVFYQHRSDGVLAAIVSKVVDADAGVVHLVVLSPVGHWYNHTHIQADVSCGGPAASELAPCEHLVGRWRWMYEGQATKLAEKHTT